MSLEKRSAQSPLSTPKEVGDQLSEIKKTLLTKANEAEDAYNKGYKLFERYQFQEAVPLLQQPLNAVPLPQFYVALGRASRDLPDEAKAEKTFRSGLLAAEASSDKSNESELAAELGIILLNKGDVDGALTYSTLALMIDENIYGSIHPRVASDIDGIGQVLLKKGDIEGALVMANVHL